MIPIPTDTPAVALETLPPRAVFAAGDPAGVYMVLEVLPEYGVSVTPNTVPCVNLRTGRAYALGRYTAAHPVPVAIALPL